MKPVKSFFLFIHKTLCASIDFEDTSSSFSRFYSFVIVEKILKNRAYQIVFPSTVMWSFKLVSLYITACVTLSHEMWLSFCFFLCFLVKQNKVV